MNRFIALFVFLCVYFVTYALNAESRDAQTLESGTQNKYRSIQKPSSVDLIDPNEKVGFSYRTASEVTDWSHQTRFPNPGRACVRKDAKIKNDLYKGPNGEMTPDKNTLILPLIGQFNSLRCSTGAEGNYFEFDSRRRPELQSEEFGYSQIKRLYIKSYLQCRNLMLLMFKTVTPENPATYNPDTGNNLFLVYYDSNKKRSTGYNQFEPYASIEIAEKRSDYWCDQYGNDYEDEYPPGMETLKVDFIIPFN